MGRFSEVLRENRQTLALASPMIANQLAQILIGWGDTVLVSRLGTLQLAACAFATMLVQFYTVFAYGLISSVSIKVSQAFGAKRYDHTGEYLWSGTWFGLGVGLVMALLIQAIAPWLHLLGQDSEMLAVGRPFLLLIGWSIVPMVLSIVWKDYSEALSRPWLPFWITMGGVVINIVLAWALIFGHLGLPAMGLTGAGVATLIARFAIAIGMGLAVVCGRWYQPYRVARIAWSKCHEQMRELFKLGWPTGLHLLSEVGLFCFASLMMGWIGVGALAAHQVAITCASTAFMVPLGLALAVTVRVGQSVGAREFHRVRSIAFGALALGSAFSLICGAFFVFNGEYIAKAFFDSAPDVATLAASLLMVAAAFGLSDAAQIIAMGGLRGLADVRVPMIYVYIAYWGVALPVSYYLGIHTRLQGLGVWIGFLVGLMLISVAVVGRLWRMSRVSEIERRYPAPKEQSEFAL